MVYMIRRIRAPSINYEHKTCSKLHSVTVQSLHVFGVVLSGIDEFSPHCVATLAGAVERVDGST
jgi:hypothetical protein